MQAPSRLASKDLYPFNVSYSFLSTSLSFCLSDCLHACLCLSIRPSFFHSVCQSLCLNCFKGFIMCFPGGFSVKISNNQTYSVINRHLIIPSAKCIYQYVHSSSSLVLTFSVSILINGCLLDTFQT